MDSETTEYFRIVAWDGCPHCAGAYDLLRVMGREVHIMFYARGSKELQEAKSRNNWKTVPMITRVQVEGDNVEETFIGGFDDLRKLLDGIGGALG